MLHARRRDGHRANGDRPLQQDRNRKQSNTKPVATSKPSDARDNVNPWTAEPDGNPIRGLFYGLLFSLTLVGGLVAAIFLAAFLISHASLAAVAIGVLVLAVLVATRPEGRR